MRLTFIFLFATFHVLYAQSMSKLAQELKHLNEVATYNVTADINFKHPDLIGFPDKGSLVAVINNRVVCYGVNGQIEWERAAPGRILAIKLSEGRGDEQVQ